MMVEVKYFVHGLQLFMHFLFCICNFWVLLLAALTGIYWLVRPRTNTDSIKQDLVHE
jgi:hypothetical protein